MRSLVQLPLCCAVLLACGLAPSSATDAPTETYLPNLDELTARTASPMAVVVERYAVDRRAMLRRHDVDGAQQRRDALRGFYEGWAQSLAKLSFDDLDQEGRVDWLLLGNRIVRELRLLDREERNWTEAAPLIPFAETILDLQVARRDLEPVDPARSATALHELRATVEETQKALANGLKAAQQTKAATTPREPSGKKAPSTEHPTKAEEPAEPGLTTTVTLARRGARLTDGLRETLSDWFRYYDGYHPSFSWWTRDPYAKLDKALEDYAKFLKREIVGEKEGEDPPVIGDPIGSCGAYSTS